jgi:hypothetical protein
MAGVHPGAFLLCETPRACTVLAPDGEPLAMGGVVDEGCGVGGIWLASSYGVERHWRAYVRTTLALVDRVVAPWRRVHVTVPEGYVETRRWLLKMGFDFGPAFLHDAGIPARIWWRGERGPT